jgi:hypothetical protein
MNLVPEDLPGCDLSASLVGVDLVALTRAISQDKTLKSDACGYMLSCLQGNYLARRRRNGENRVKFYCVVKSQGVLRE